jgi:hypothetical protein
MIAVTCSSVELMDHHGRTCLVLRASHANKPKAMTMLEQDPHTGKYRLPQSQPTTEPVRAPIAIIADALQERFIAQELDVYELSQGVVVYVCYVDDWSGVEPQRLIGSTLYLSDEVEAMSHCHPHTTD